MLANQASLIGKLSANERPYFKGRKWMAFLRVTSQAVLWPPRMCMCPHIHMYMHTHIIAKIREEGDFKHSRGHNCLSSWSVFAQYGIPNIDRMKGGWKERKNNKKTEERLLHCMVRDRRGCFCCQGTVDTWELSFRFFSVSCLTYPYIKK